MGQIQKEVQITSEAVKKYQAASVDEAILQAIYNSLDADATEIKFEVKNAQDTLFNNIDGAEVCDKIVITDNGSGIEHERFDALFLPFEQSWKKGEYPKFRRPYHGCNGSGRFKYFALGQELKWETVYKNGDDFYSYSASLNINDPQHFIYDEKPNKINKQTTGTVLTISRLTSKCVKFLTSSINLSNQIISGLLLDLELDSKLKIYVQNEILDTNSKIEQRKKLSCSIQDSDGKTHQVECEVIAWKNDVKFVNHKHSFYYNSNGQYIDKNASGFPADTRMPVHTLIIKSSVFDGKDWYGNSMSPYYLKIDKELEPYILEFLTSVKNKNLSAQLNSIICSQDYPFKTPVQSPIEDAQRTAYNAILYSLIFNNSGVVTEKKPQILKVIFPLLKNLFSGDYVLSENIDAILQLNPDEKEKFSRMVNRIKLSKLLARYDKYIHRTCFLNTLEKLVHEKQFSQSLEERTQLHKIVAEEAWIFGRLYDNEDLVTSDKGIVTLIRQLNLRDDLYFEDMESDKKLAKIEKYIRENKDNLDSCIKKIPDLVLCKKSDSNNTCNYRIIELKKPTVSIDHKCLDQALNIYKAISNAARNKGGLYISENHKWEYFLVSSSMSKELENEIGSTGHLRDLEKGNYVINVLLWREIIDEARRRLQKELDDITILVEEDDCASLLKSYKERFNVQGV